MFFIGISSSFLPYILAVIFAWLLFGGNTDVPVSQDDASATAKVIQHQPSIIKTHKNYQYQSHFISQCIFEYTDIPLGILSEWGGLCNKLHYTFALVLLPNRRGPPFNF